LATDLGQEGFKRHYYVKGLDWRETWLGENHKSKMETAWLTILASSEGTGEADVGNERGRRRTKQSLIE